MIGLEILFYNLKLSFYSSEGTENQKFYHIKIVKSSNMNIMFFDRDTFTSNQIIYRTRAIISRGLYSFLPNFHFSCGLYYRQFMY